MHISSWRGVRVSSVTSKTFIDEKIEELKALSRKWYGQNERIKIAQAPRFFAHDVRDQHRKALAKAHEEKRAIETVLVEIIHALEDYVFEKSAREEDEITSNITRVRCDFSFRGVPRDVTDAEFAALDEKMNATFESNQALTNRINEIVAEYTPWA